MKHITGQLIVACTLIGLSAPSALAGDKQHEPGAANVKPATAGANVVEEPQLEGPDETLQLRFEVLELRLSPAEVERINRSTQTFDVAPLATAVAERGDAKVKYCFGGPVALNEEASLTVGHRLPFVTSSSVTKGGQRISAVEYEVVGCVVNLIPVLSPTPAGSPLKVTFEVEVSGFGPQSAVEIADGLHAPTFGELKQEFTAHLPLGKDVCFWALATLEQVQGSTGDMAVYVYRVRFDPASGDWPRPPTGPGLTAISRAPAGRSARRGCGASTRSRAAIQAYRA